MDAIPRLAIGNDHLYAIQTRPQVSCNRLPHMPLLLPRILSTEESIKLLERIHDNGGKPFECSYCSRPFSTLRYLKKHEMTHVPGPNSNDCPKCGISFSKPSALKNHQIKGTCQEENVGCCDITFSRRSDLLRHQQDFHNGQKIKSNTHSDCGKNVSMPGTLKAHENVHKEWPVRRKRAKPQSFECKDCMKVFVDREKAIKHSWTHIGEKPLVCNICGKWYNLKNSFSLHLCTHSCDAEKLCHCSYCNKACKSSGDCQRQERTHAGEKRFHCLYCNQSFFRSSTLTNHHLARHPEHRKYYPCEECGKPFALQSALRSHVQTHSKDSNSNLRLPEDTLVQGQNVEKRLPKGCVDIFRNSPKGSEIFVVRSSPHTHHGMPKRPFGGKSTSSWKEYKKILNIKSHQDSGVTVRNKVCLEATVTMEAEKSICNGGDEALQDYMFINTFDFKREAAEYEARESDVLENNSSCLDVHHDKTLSGYHTMECRGGSESVNNDTFHIKTEVIENEGCGIVIESIKSENNGYCVEECGTRTVSDHHAMELERVNECVDSTGSAFHIKKEVIENEECKVVIGSIKSENDGYCLQERATKTDQPTVGSQRVNERVDSSTFCIKTEIVENEDCGSVSLIESTKLENDGNYMQLCHDKMTGLLCYGM